MVATKLVFTVFKSKVVTLSVKLVEFKVIDGIFPIKVFELMFVFKAIKEVLLVFILKVEAFIVLVKNVPVVLVEVKDRVEILLSSVFVFNVVFKRFAVTVEDPTVILLELIFVFIAFKFAVIMVTLKFVVITSRFVAFILVLYPVTSTLSPYMFVFLFVVPKMVPFVS